MNIIFTKAGKYGSAPKESVEVTVEDVKAEKVYPIADGYAKYFLEAGVAKAGGKPVEEPTAGFSSAGLEDMKVGELKEFAEKHDPPIDLGEASKKAEILEVIQKALEA